MQLSVQSVHRDEKTLLLNKSRRDVAAVSVVYTERDGAAARPICRHARRWRMQNELRETTTVEVRTEELSLSWRAGVAGRWLAMWRRRACTVRALLSRDARCIHQFPLRHSDRSSPSSSRSHRPYGRSALSTVPFSYFFPPSPSVPPFSPFFGVSEERREGRNRRWRRKKSRI